MRIVLDTNVLVRATKSATGPARELLNLLDSDKHFLILSPFILMELLRVLSYPRVLAMHRLSIEDCHEFVRSLDSAAEVVDVNMAPAQTIASDPDDDPVIQTAIQGRADVLCTRDRHLLHQDVQEFCKQHSVRVMTDVDLLQELRSSSNE